MGVEAALLEGVVEQGEHGGRGWFLCGGGAHDAADQGGEEGCGGGFSADVAEDDGGAVAVVFNKIVEVAADRAGGQEFGGEVGIDVGGNG